MLGSFPLCIEYILVLLNSSHLSHLMFDGLIVWKLVTFLLFTFFVLSSSYLLPLPSRVDVTLLRGDDALRCSEESSG